MGYRVADWPLFKTGFINELKMAFVAYSIGCCFGVALGDIGKRPTILIIVPKNYNYNFGVKETHTSGLIML